MHRLSEVVGLTLLQPHGFAADNAGNGSEALFHNEWALLDRLGRTMRIVMRCASTHRRQVTSPTILLGPQTHKLRRRENTAFRSEGYGSEWRNQRCATALLGTSRGASTVPIACVVLSMTPMRRLYLPGGSEMSWCAGSPYCCTAT